jgi:hypothetical protein
MIDAGFVAEIIDNAKRAPHVVPFDGTGRVFAPNDWADLTPKPPAVEVLRVGTLTGFVEYVTANPDSIKAGETFVHVKEPGTVLLRGKLADEAAQFRRHTYLAATIELVGQPFAFGTYHEADVLFVALQTQFVASAAVTELLALIASIRESSVRDTVDTGVAQEVKTGKGIALVGTQRIPNPVALAPYRTFREIKQPESLFVLRARTGQGEKPQLALFEADGGAWKLAAIAAVRSYLVGKVGTLAVVA